MKNDYILIVLVLITVGLSLLLWKYPQNGGGRGDGGGFYFADGDVPFNPNAPPIRPTVPNSDINDVFGYNQVAPWVGGPPRPYGANDPNYNPPAGYVPPKQPKPTVDDSGFKPPVLLPPKSIVNLGIAAQTTAQQYATATTNYQNMLQNLPNTGANIQKVDAAKKAKDAAYAKAQSVRKDFYKQRDTLNAGQQKALAKVLSKPPSKTK